MIKANISKIQGKIASVCKKIGRNPSEVILIGVTKYAEADKIKEAIEAGLTHIGENKVQEAQRKFPALEPFNAKMTKHMIGHLQTNKVKPALRYFDFIQSVDSLKLAVEIEKQATVLNKNVDILVEVNTSMEEQKFGMDAYEVIPLIEEISRLPHIRVRGLMTISALTDRQEVARKCFQDLRFLNDRCKEAFAGRPGVNMQFLSMGMTDDYEIALEEGSNMLRIGRAIFAEEKAS
ncbi:MAG: YggS family pyridoxal phosphate enzyme [Omnitrophica WOR_2 bacterium GWA2_45_18]|nr:MAG: YggS family pyridoxal phosphate enzyme [Omnitrophica WOR_2 bacterium GWA2_45_18]